jgi:hypothetical protein
MPSGTATRVVGTQAMPAKERSTERVPTIHDGISAPAVGPGIARPARGRLVALARLTKPRTSVSDLDDQREVYYA